MTIFIKKIRIHNIAYRYNIHKYLFYLTLSYFILFYFILLSHHINIISQPIISNLLAILLSHFYYHIC
jgi:hypothetical protein